MPTVVVGAGPAGLFTAIALARRGRRITVVDRDPGPQTPQHWPRRGVMQFDHAHTFRAPAIDALHAEMPDVLRDLRRAGAAVVTADGGAPIVLRCRRTVFERVLRDVAAGERRIDLVTAHVDGVRTTIAGRAVGVSTGGRQYSADLVIDASGRASRVMRDVRGAGEGGPCGAMYVSRQYRIADSAQPGPVNSPVGLSLPLRGYFAVMFLHDNQNFSITITHGGTDARLQRLRDPAIFEAAIRAIPMLSDWIEPHRAQPITPVLPGGRLYNSYRRQVDDNGQPTLPGLISVGDSVCTTTPLAGRGVSLAFLQAQRLVEILSDHPRDHALAAAEFDAWCRDHIRPWYLDHQHCDTDRLRRWAGGDVDLSRPLPSDLVVAAGAVDPTVRDAAAPYDRMSALPATLDALQQRARDVYASGWRPPLAEGPTREELGRLCVELDACHRRALASA